MADPKLDDDFDARARVKLMAEEARRRGNPSEWFDGFYRDAGGDSATIPWADGAVNPNLAAWLEENPRPGGGRKALVVGCGLGDDAEELARMGFEVTAFDIAPAAIDWCRKRFPETKVHYLAADVFQPPKEWRGQFDFIFEAYTLQALPPEYRDVAMKAIARLLKRGGELLVICRGCEPLEERTELPWPLTIDELLLFEQCGLRPETFEDFIDETRETPVRRFRILYRA
jgi:SAM-dependent methyltransferase